MPVRIVTFKDFIYVNLLIFIYYLYLFILMPVSPGVCVHADPTLICRGCCYLGIDLKGLLPAEDTELVVMSDKMDQEIPQRGSEKQGDFLLQSCQLTALQKSWCGGLFLAVLFPG